MLLSPYITKTQGISPNQNMIGLLSSYYLKVA